MLASRPRSPLLAIALLSMAAVSTAYDLVRDYSGQHFFNGWDWYGSWDNLTLSSVWWLNETAATAANLAYVNPAGQAVIRVDNTTNLPPGQDRNTVRITTTDTYDFGSVWVFDATHMPYGCSVWPAFWAKGPNWPFDGEIDIVEGINMMTSNQMAIHTTGGCTTNNSIVQTGTLGFTDCSAGSGCTVHETKPNSFGAGFAQAGGGVWATQFDVAGIFIWYWSRPDVPAELTQNASSIDISSWGTPSAAYPTTASCPLTNFFTPQQLVIDIALCGDWAGVPSIYSSTCQGSCSVSGPGSPAYDDAYFEINYVRAYTTGGAATTSTAASGSPTGAAAATTTTTGAATVITSSAGSAQTGSPQQGNTSGGRSFGASAGAVALVSSLVLMLLTC